jgi:hypothetical protein
MAEIQSPDSSNLPIPSASELSPDFIARMIQPDSWDRIITRTSADNLVGVVDDKVVKQSKLRFDKPEAALAAKEYVTRSYALHQQFLPEYTTDTQFYTHADRNYAIQPLLTDKPTLELSEEEARDPALIAPFADLYRKLYTLYRAERDATRYIPEERRFLLSRIQPFSRQAQEGRFVPPVRVLTVANIMCDVNEGKFSIVDFGRWLPWKPEMQESYDRIVAKAQAKFEKYEL